MIYEEHAKSRHPFEFLVVAFCVFSGSVQVLTDRAPSNIARAVGEQFQSLWSWSMLIGGLFALVGILIKDPVIGSYFELGGMCGLGFGNAVYGVAVLLLANPPGTTYAGPVTISISLACFVRALKLIWCLWRDLHQEPDERLVSEVKTQLSEAVEAEARHIVENREKDKGGE